MEAIIARLDSGEAGLRETLELCQEGRRLVEFCASELEAVGRGLEELRLRGLVARPGAGGGGGALGARPGGAGARRAGGSPGVRARGCARRLTAAPAGQDGGAAPE